RLLHRHLDRDGARAAAAREARARSRRPALRRDGVGRRLPLQTMTMVRSAAVALVACLAGAAVVGAVYGWHGAWTTFLLLAAVALGMLGAAHLATARRARLGSLSRQLALGAVLAVATVVAAVWVGAMAMFVSRHDALVISAMAAVGGVVAVR